MVHGRSSTQHSVITMIYPSLILPNGISDRLSTPAAHKNRRSLEQKGPSHANIPLQCGIPACNTYTQQRLCSHSYSSSIGLFVDGMTAHRHQSNGTNRGLLETY